MKLNMKRIYIAIGLVFSLFLGSVGGLVWAQNMESSTSQITERWQTVYVIAKPTGDPSKVVVVDMLKGRGKALSLSIPADMPVSKVKAYTDGVKAIYNDGKIIIDGENADTVYYRADVEYAEGTLPFTYHIKWYFNGKEISPDDMMGKTGTVRLVFSMKSNAKVDDTYVPFLGMLTVSIDTRNASKVQTDDLPPMVVGSDYQVSGMIMALDEEKSTYVEWYTKRFTYPDIKVVVIPYMMDIPLPDMAGPLNKLADNIKKLSALPEAHKKIVDGMYKSIDPDKVHTLATGLKQMKDGVSQMVKELDKALTQPAQMDVSKLDQMEMALRNIAKALNGYHQIISSLAAGHSSLIKGALKLQDGTAHLNQGIVSVNEGVKNLLGASSQLKEGSAKLVDASSQLYNASVELKDGAHNLYDGIIRLNSGLNTIVSAIDEETTPLYFLATGTTGVPTLGEIAGKVASVDGNLAKALMMYQKVASDTLKAHLKLVNGVKTWQTSFVSVVAGMKNLYEGLSKLSIGIKGVSDGIGNVNNGIVQLEMGLSQIEKGTSSLALGSQALTEGIARLIDGLNREYKVIITLRDGGQIKEDVTIPSLTTLAFAVNQIADGVDTMKGTLKDKSQEAKQMLENLRKLRDALIKVESGLDQAYQGTLQLENGMRKIKDLLKVLAYGGKLEGKDVPPIDKTSDILNDMAQGIREKANEIIKNQDDIQRYKDAASKYTSFLGKLNDVPSHVVFVIVPKQ